MASLLEDYMIPDPVPGYAGPDPAELERAKYLALARAGFGVAQREPIGKAMTAGVNTYLGIDQNTRRDALAKAELALKQHQAMAQQVDDMNKAMLLSKLTREQLQAMKLPEAVIDAIKYAKDPGEKLAAFKTFYEPRVLSAQQTVYDPIKGRPEFQTAGPKGEIINYGANGQMSMGTVPGALETQAGIAGAVRGAEQANTIQTAQGPAGMQTNYGANLFGQPPALQQRGPQAAPPQQPPTLNFDTSKMSPAEMKAALDALQKQYGVGAAREASAAASGDRTIYGADPIKVDQAKKVFDTVSSRIDAQYKELLPTVNQTLPLIGEVRSALESGKIITGAGADFRLQFDRLLSLGGFKDAQGRVQDTQAFANTMKRFVLTTITALGSGSGVSDQDRKYAAEIAAADISLDKESIKRLVDVADRVGRLSIESHNKKVGIAADEFKDEKLRKFYTYDIPEPYKSPAAPAATAPFGPPATGGMPNVTTTGFPKGPPVGTKMMGKTFKGGNPKDPANWQ